MQQRTKSCCALVARTCCTAHCTSAARSFGSFSQMPRLPCCRQPLSASARASEYSCVHGRATFPNQNGFDMHFRTELASRHDTEKKVCAPVRVSCQTGAASAFLKEQDRIPCSHACTHSQTHCFRQFRCAVCHTACSYQHFRFVAVLTFGSLGPLHGSTRAPPYMSSFHVIVPAVSSCAGSAVARKTALIVTRCTGLHVTMH